MLSFDRAQSHTIAFYLPLGLHRVKLSILHIAFVVAYRNISVLRWKVEAESYCGNLFCKWANAAGVRSDILKRFLILLVEAALNTGHQIKLALYKANVVDDVLKLQNYSTFKWKNSFLLVVWWRFTSLHVDLIEDCLSTISWLNLQIQFLAQFHFWLFFILQVC